MTWLRRVPAAMTTLRLLLGVVVILLAAFRFSGLLIAGCVTAALLSDVYDGILARRLGVETEALRRYDSVADTLFYVGVALAVWILFPEVMRRNWSLLLILLAMELLRYLFDLVKFRREASYHMYSAKAFGIVLAIAMVILFVTGFSGWLFQLAVVVGIISDLEGLAISLLLPAWRIDVRSVTRAYALRRALKTSP